MKKKSLITILILLIVIAIAYCVLVRNPNHVSKELAQCIGENSEFYVQLGCHACRTQEEMFGENQKYLNIIDCWYERDKCSKIRYTPTWIINNQEYIGVQSIEKLKELTGC